MRSIIVGQIQSMIAIVFIALIISTAASAKTLKVPSQYSTIQSAVNAAVPGDAIQVSAKPGNAPYSESVTVATPSLSITATGAVLDGGGANGSGNGFTVEANSVAITGFTIQNFIKNQTNLAENPRAGIYELNVTSASIKNVTSIGNDQGCYIEGSLDLVIQNCTFSNNLEEGIRAVDGTSPSITNNTIKGNANGAGAFYAVAILGINGMAFTNNNMSNNANGISVETAAQGPNPPGVPPALTATVSNNTVNNNSGESITVDGSYLVTVSNNLLSGNLFGILVIDGSLQCTVANNVVSGTSLATYYNAGILIGSGSTSCSVSNNIVDNNISDGIDVLDSIGNTINNDIAIGNTSQGSVDATDNTTDIGPHLNTWKNNIFGVTSPAGLK